MEYLVAFMFLPSILWAITGPGKQKLNNFVIQTLEEVVDSLPEEAEKKKKP